MHDTPRLRRGAALTVATLLVGAIAAPVLAAAPERTWIGEETILYDGYCEFPVLLQDSHSSVKELAFPEDGGGSLRYQYPGVFQSTLTNLDAEVSTEVVLGSQVRFDERPDGTAGASAWGSFLLYYTAEEAAVSEVGQGLFLGHGRAHEEYDETGLVSASFDGRLIDLCAVLGD